MIGNPIPSLWDFYRDHAQPAMLALARAGNQGVWVDRDMRTRLTSETEAELVGLQTQLKALTNLDLNPNSPKQVSEYLYDNLHLAMPYDRQSRKYTRSTKEQVLEDLAIKYPPHKDLLYLILDYRGKQKLIGTFLTNELDHRGKLVTSYHATGTVGGRISSSTTIFGEGGNMQQFPRGPLRRMIVAPPGRCFIKVDLSQAEARVVAWVARDLELIENFCDPGFDVHKWNAALVFGIPLASVTKDLRDKGKARVHAANYHGGANAAAKIARVPYHEAKAGLERFWAQRPILIRWWSEIDATIDGDPTTYFARYTMGGRRWLRTPFGRKRVMLGRLNDELRRSAYSFLPSGTVADIINRAFYRLSALLPDGDFPVLQVHDEIVVECAIANTAANVSLVRRECEVPIYIPETPCTLTIPADISTGPNWFDQEKVTSQ
ncbi:MAG: hypothetical protein IMZ62_01960 [Chloroflexi bacterium]|nr:hypothetical protein [Chloroflexota bacterium]